jgi:hypothetical protein
MALVEINWRPPNRDLRLFAVLQVLFLGLVAFFVLPRAGNAALMLFGFSAVMGVVGLAAPQAIRWFYLAWMIVVYPVGWVVTHVLMAAVFYLLITPVGFAMQLVGYDPLRRKLDRSARSYWVPRDGAVDKQRWFKQY